LEVNVLYQILLKKSSLWLNGEESFIMLKICQYCGKEFEAKEKGNREKYCCEEHRKAAIREKRMKPLHETTCPVCLKTFMPKAGNQVVCSEDCRKERAKEQRKNSCRENYVYKQRPKKTKLTYKSKGIDFNALTPDQKLFYGRTQEKAYLDELRVIIPSGLTKFKDRKVV
jgi:hypothetical protein